MALASVVSHVSVAHTFSPGQILLVEDHGLLHCLKMRYAQRECLGGFSSFFFPLLLIPSQTSGRLDSVANLPTVQTLLMVLRPIAGKLGTDFLVHELQRLLSRNF